MNIATPNTHFSNVQLDLLKLFSHDVPDNDLIEIKRLIVNYMGNRASLMAEKILNEKGISTETILHTHLRTPYN